METICGYVRRWAEQHIDGDGGGVHERRDGGSRGGVGVDRPTDCLTIAPVLVCRVTVTGGEGCGEDGR